MWKPLMEQRVFLALSRDDADVRRCMDFVQVRRVRLYSGYLAEHIGALWLPGRLIVFNRRYLPATGDVSIYTMSLFLHELCHLRQGPRTALSVYGELEAWQLGFRYMRRHGQGSRHPAIADLLALPLARERDVLLEARRLMQDYAGKAYRADLLPLLPLGDRFLRR